jgi:hypothetical protein
LGRSGNIGRGGGFAAGASLAGGSAAGFVSLTGTPSVSSNEFQRSDFPGSGIKAFGRRREIKIIAGARQTTRSAHAKLGSSRNILGCASRAKSYHEGSYRPRDRRWFLFPGSSLE